MCAVCFDHGLGNYPRPLSQTQLVMTGIMSDKVCDASREIGRGLGTH